MCIDVDRNDKSRISEPGSVRVIGRRQIEMYWRPIRTVHVEGMLRNASSASNPSRSAGNAAPKWFAPATVFGSSVAGQSHSEGNAVIEDLMAEQNCEEIEALGLAFNVWVVNGHESNGRMLVISSANSNSTICFHSG